jgi:hypothetical protein
MRRLGHPQRPVADRQESGRGARKQKGSDNRRDQAAPSDGHQEPEPKSAEQRDKGPDEDDQGVPGALATVLVEIQSELSSGQDAEEQGRPYQRGVLATIECLSGEIAGQAVQGHGYQSQDHLPRQRRAPPRPFGLDGLVSYLRSHGSGGSLVSGTSAAAGEIGGLAGPQALIFHRLVGCVHATDHVRHVRRHRVHNPLLPVTVVRPTYLASHDKGTCHRVMPIEFGYGICQTSMNQRCRLMRGRQPGESPY